MVRIAEAKSDTYQLLFEDDGSREGVNQTCGPELEVGPMRLPDKLSFDPTAAGRTSAQQRCLGPQSQAGPNTT
jgi:hypothetical protein